MKPPIIRGTMARRVLINYQIRPDALAGVLPAPFRPKLIHGKGIGGVCLIRLEKMRPRFTPAAMGIASENAAHRFAIEWDDRGETKEGVFIPLRHTNSRWNAMAGGRVFPGEHRLANVWTADSGNRVKVEIRTMDNEMVTRVAGRAVDHLPSHSVFDTVPEATAFFRAGALGWSPDRLKTGFEGLKLVAYDWEMCPFKIEHLRSNLFQDLDLFPVGSVRFDSAFLMRNIHHEWHPLGPFIPTRKEAA
ncbi:DUF2071 domain-containing protein [bacterium]|nr:DUF2071 domain-containing protein [bacterium]